MLSSEVHIPNSPGDEVLINCEDSHILAQSILSFAKNPTLKNLHIINTASFDLLLKQFNSVFLHIEAGGGIVCCKDSSILFIFRNGKWDLPKGKPDKQEDITETAVREVEEETGISGVKIIQPAGITRHAYLENSNLYLKTTFWFKMRVEGKPDLTPQFNEGITDARWVSREETANILEIAYPSIKDLVENCFANQ